MSMDYSSCSLFPLKVTIRNSHISCYMTLNFCTKDGQLELYQLNGNFYPVELAIAHSLVRMPRPELLNQTAESLHVWLYCSLQGCHCVLLTVCRLSGHRERVVP